MADNMHQAETHRPRIVVLGAGFGGLTFAQNFDDSQADVVVVDRQNHHLFQPLLYQVATAGLSAPEIAKPIRQILRQKRHTTVLMDEAVDLDLTRREIQLRDRPQPLPYDYLVLAVGARTNYFGNDQWEQFAPGLKSLDDATRLRHNLLLAFEEAENTDDPELRERLLTFVVVGGGPTGVEMAGAIAELARHVLDRDFKRVDLKAAKVILVEGMDRVLPPFPQKLSESARRQLEEMGVEVITGELAKDIRKGEIELPSRTIKAENIIWTAGVKASALLDQLPVEKDRGGRIMVKPDCSLPGFDHVFALGDIINLKDTKGRQVPGIAPGAMQTGEYVAKLIGEELKAQAAHQKLPERKPFTYWDKGNMATIGKKRAVAQVGKLEFGGFFAWLGWLFIHLMFLIGFRNKLAVLLQWAYAYIRDKRGARVITNMDGSFLFKNEKAQPVHRALLRRGRSHSVAQTVAGGKQ
ncbi:MAG: NAD(P)/FAD-dependent oxidoreductase [Verrucomicrobiota bacterium JB022]|nr:NAD(P)/FAD-dependent oxidoreductase [Verrucomicrobiota bacterium JB022]